jgi:hypothetical protein
MTGLINDTAEYWKAKDVRIREWLEDGGGRYGFTMKVHFGGRTHGQTFVVTARTSMRTPLGVMTKLVKRAQDDDALLLVRAGDDGPEPRFYVFNPDTIMTHGEVITADDARKSRGEVWVDFHPKWGVRLKKYAFGRADPAAPDDDLPPLPEDGDDDPDPSGPTMDEYGG